MKIAFTCPYDMSAPGGVEEIIVQVTNRLKERGNEVFIITVKPKHKIKLNNVVIFGEPLYTMANGSTGNIAIESLSDDTELAAFLDKEKFDVICIESPDTPFLNWEVLAHSNSLNVGWFHSTTFVNLDSFPYNLVTFPLENWLSDQFRGLIAASPTVVKTWKGIFDSKNKLVLPAGTDVEKFSSAKKINLGPQANMLFLGRLDERKGVLEAIKAFDEIQKGVNSKLWIIGNGPQKEEAHKMVADLKIENKVVFLGFISDKDLPGYYRSADVYLAPSLGGESVGVVLLDAMAAGVPIVAYNNVGYKFTLKGNPWKGSLVSVGHYKKMAESALEILNNNNLRKKVIEWQKEKVKQFDWEVITDKFLEYVEKISGLLP